MSITRPITRSVTRPVTRAVTAGIGGAQALAYQALLDLNPVLLIPSINDAYAEGRLWQDIGMTAPATAADDPVRVVEDYSGNAYSFTAPSDAARPLLKQDGGGNWYLDFNGAKSMATVGLDGQAAFTAVSVVIGITGKVSNTGVAIARRKLATGTNFHCFANGNTYNDAAYDGPVGELVDEQTYVLSWLMSATTVVTYADGAEIDSRSKAMGSLSTGEITIGRPLSDDPGADFTGKIYGVFLKTSVINAGQLATVNTYIADNS